MPKSLLLVEPEPRARWALEQLLSAKRFHVDVAGSGIEALAKLERFRPDLLLVDLPLPDMEPARFATALADIAAQPFPPLLVFGDGPDTEHQAQLLGARGYLSRLARLDDLLAVIRRLTRKVLREGERLEAQQQRIAARMSRLETVRGQARRRPVEPEDQLTPVGAETVPARSILGASAAAGPSALSSPPGLSLLEAILQADRRFRDLETTQLEQLLDLTRDAIAVRRFADARLVYWNAGAETLYGYSRREALGRVSYALLHTRFPEPLAEIERILAADGYWEGELVQTRKDGSTVNVLGHWALGRDAEGRPDRILEIHCDYFAHKLLTDRQRTFLSLVVHDLRTPLTTLVLLAQLAQRNPTHSRQLAEGVLAQARRLERLVNDLQDTWQMDSGQLKVEPKRIELGAVLRTLVRDLGRLYTDHQIQLEEIRTPIYGWWDRDRLEQILDNLIGNAVKFSPPGSAIRLRARATDEAVEITVSDQGVGISPEAMPYIFEPYYRAESAEKRGAKGWGLGLHVVKTLVEAHGGHIWVESTPGAGTTFFLRFPKP